MKLDLGAGAHPRDGFTPVDRVKVTPDTFALDLVSGDVWPWQDSSIEELSSSHFIEHIPADEVTRYRKRDYPPGDPTPTHCRIYVEKYQQDRLLFFFDEAFRVIKPGGLFHLTWPALQSTDAFRDPTHRRFIPLEFLHYLSREGRASMGLEHYEAACDWTCQGAQIHFSPGEHPPDFSRQWDAVKAYSVTLTAKK